MTAHVMCTGQEDNLGDVALRRRMLAPFLAAGPCSVFVGSASPSFVRALRIPDGHTVHRSFRRWWLGALLDLRHRRRWAFGHDAGELTGNTRTLVWQLAVLPLVLAGAALRRPRLRLGVGLRSTGGWGPRLLRPVLATASVLTWREPTGAAWSGRGELLADWAFGEEPVPPGPARELLVVSLRGDRAEPSDAWVRAVREVAGARGLTVVVAPQVRSDAALAVRLAPRLGGRLDPWEAQDHLAREAELRALYGRAAGVVSDRLHALVLGFVDGAVPIGLMEHADVKIGRHFAAVGVDDVSWDVSGRPVAQLADRLTTTLDRGADVLAHREPARALVGRMDRLVATALR